MTLLLDAALTYANRGWYVFPCHETDADGNCSCSDPACKWPDNTNAGKHPRTEHGHTDATTDPEQIRQWWGRWPNANIGIWCAKSGVSVLDVDPRHGGDDEFNDLARQIGRLDSPRVRTGSGGWHVYLTSPKDGVRGKLRGCKGIDVKHNGYVIAPPSVHPCGEPYVWEVEGEPIDPPKPWLNMMVHPPLSKRGVSADNSPVCEDELIDALRVIPSDEYETWIHVGMSIKAAVGDEGCAIWDEWSSTAPNYDADIIPRKWASFSAGGGITKSTVFGLARQHGWQPPLRLCTPPPDDNSPPRTDDDIPPEYHADAEIIDIGPSPRTPIQKRPGINVSTDIPRMVDEAEESILSMPRRNLYQRSGGLVRIARDAKPAAKGQTRPDGAISIKPAPISYLREMCSSAADWHRFDKREKEWVPILPPRWIAETLADRGQWSIPPIMGIITAPTLRPDGTVLDSPGYDDATGLLNLPGGTTYPPVPDNPTQHDAVKAMDYLKEPFVDFPFSELSDFSAALASVLALVCRAAIAGPVPLFAIRATTAGTGKTLLADLVSIIGTGRPAPKFAQAEQPEEDRKRLLAVAMEGDPVMCIDNVARPLGTGPIDMALTSGVVKDRVLGITGNAEAPFRCVTFATGNNLQVRGDTGRRIIPVDLDAKCERPELRTDWQHPGIETWTAQHRAQLVSSALTVCRAHAIAGWPEMDLAPLGSFEDFSRVARAAVVWCGMPDPCEGTARIRKEADPDLDTLRSLLHAWHDHYGSGEKTLRDVCEEVDDGFGDEAKALNAAIADAIAGRKKGTVSTRLGYAMRGYRGRIVDGLRFMSGDKMKHGVPWRVEELDR